MLPNDNKAVFYSQRHMQALHTQACKYSLARELLNMKLLGEAPWKLKDINYLAKSPHLKGERELSESHYLVVTAWWYEDHVCVCSVIYLLISCKWPYSFFCSASLQHSETSLGSVSRAVLRASGKSRWLQSLPYTLNLGFRTQWQELRKKAIYRHISGWDSRSIVQGLLLCLSLASGVHHLVEL